MEKLANPEIVAKDSEDFERTQWSSLIFKRIQEVYNTPIQVFNNIDPNDILQHELGDCYFLSALSSLAEFPNRIRKLINTTDSPNEYIVHFYDLGVKTPYKITDEFPSEKDEEHKEKLAFSQPEIENSIIEIWVLLLEKAWAKRFGSYSKIGSGGFLCDSLHDLCGSPCEEILDLRGDKVWGKIYEANRLNFIIAAGTSGEDGQGNEVLDTGIVAFHAYSILNAQEVSTDRGVERLLNIRNPWGNTEWTGDWSDSSSLWTDAIKKQLGWVNQDDGSFWMRFEEFIYNYSTVTICRYYDNYFFNVVVASHEIGKNSIFLINSSEGGDCYFTLSQQELENETLKYSPVRMIIAKQLGNKLERLAGMVTGNLKDSWLQVNLTPGQYLVYLEILGQTPFGFSTYSSSPTEIILQGTQNFYDKVYNIDLAQAIGKKKQLTADTEYYEVNIEGVDPMSEKNTEAISFNLTYQISAKSVIHKEIKAKSFLELEAIGILP